MREIKASEAAEAMEYLSINGIDVEAFRNFVKELAKAAEIIVDNFKKIMRCYFEHMRQKESGKKERRFNVKMEFKAMKMRDQVMCNRPRFAVRKII